jgi:hypothetical protein
MPEYARVVTFDADAAGLDAMINEISSSDGPPEGVNAKRLTVLADRAAGKVLIAVRFGSEDDLKKAAAVFEAMSPPSGSGVRRVAVDAYEVVLDRDA